MREVELMALIRCGVALLRAISKDVREDDQEKANDIALRVYEESKCLPDELAGIGQRLLDELESERMPSATRQIVVLREL